MRDIASNRITGPQAIVVAAVTWWLETSPRLRDLVHEALRSAVPERFTSMHEWDLGTACGDNVAAADALFWDAAKGDSGVRHMVEQAVRAWKVEGGLPEKIQDVRRFVRHLVHCEAGRTVKSSGFLERHAAEIQRARRQKARRR